MTPRSTDMEIRVATSADERVLWQMLYYAAHMDEDGAESYLDAQTDPFLAAYVAGWGRPGDIGLIAWRETTPMGAVWSRMLPTPLVAGTPELAVAVVPAYQRDGIGTRLLAAYREFARAHLPAVALSVRVGNPAYRLYLRSGFTSVGTIVNRVGAVSNVMLQTFAGAD